jgi:hypothetical protein
MHDDARRWTTALLALSVCAGCYESHAAAPRGVDAGDDVPPSACPFPDEAVVVVDDTPGCRFVTVDASDGPAMCADRRFRSLGELPLRASVRVIHRGRREYMVGHRGGDRSDPGDRTSYTVYAFDPARRSSYDAAECACEDGLAAMHGSNLIWRSQTREAGSETRLLLGTTRDDPMIEVSVCVDADVYDEDDDPPALGR